MDIKRFNNMMSDHGIYSRKTFILVNGAYYIELDAYAKREVAVTYVLQDGSH